MYTCRGEGLTTYLQYTTAVYTVRLQYCTVRKKYSCNKIVLQIIYDKNKLRGNLMLQYC
jgi:hypothetical protein